MWIEIVMSWVLVVGCVRFELGRDAYVRCGLEFCIQSELTLFSFVSSIRQVSDTPIPQGSPESSVDSGRGLCAARKQTRRRLSTNREDVQDSMLMDHD